MGESDELKGRLIADRYRLRGPLGRGGMGEVWEAYDERLDGRRVAVKMMLAESPSAASPEQEGLETRRERFLREVRTTAGIEHLGIPAVYDAGTDLRSGRLFVVMQLLRGRELQTLVDETDHAEEPLPIAFAAALGAQIASVLDEVHRHDVVHRDIKPNNLMLTPGGIVKVLDFGVAYLSGLGDNLRLTQVGMTVGTPPYMSPEQALANSIGPTSDVYALACVLYEVLTGRPVFTESATRSLLWHHVHSAPAPVRVLRPEVPVEIEGLLLAMLHKDADARPDAAETYERLLPFATAGTAAGLAEYDPRLPFVRPLGGGVRRRRADQTPSSAPGPALTEREIEEISDHVASLLEQERFVEAFDLLEEARSRAATRGLRNELTARLAHAKFIAGNFTEAAELFAEVGGYYTARYGPGDADAQIARYFLAQCRIELGDASGAVTALQDVVDAVVDPSDSLAVDRHLDALTSLMRLHAAARQRERLQAVDARMREAIRRYRLQDAEAALADLDAYVARLTRLLAE